MSHTLSGARGLVHDPEEVLRIANTWSKAKGAEILLADAGAVFGMDHLVSALRHAERAKAAGSTTTHSLAMETLLYLSGKRQIADAIRVAGIRPGSRTIALLIIPAAPPEELLSQLGWTRDDSVLDADGKSLSVLGITEEEERTISEADRNDLALERTALLDIQK